jgi:transposase
MPAPYPVELKEAAVAAFERGEGTADEVAERFGVGRSSLLAWAKQLRDRGTLNPAPRGGGNFSQVDLKRLLRVLDARRDSTTDELTKAYNAGRPKGERVHRSSILRALKREGFVFKKNARGPQSRTGPMSARSGSSSSAG